LALRAGAMAEAEKPARSLNKLRAARWTPLVRLRVR